MSFPNTTDAPVFVVGVTRSGTTLFKQILNRHPRLSLYHEAHYLRRVWAHTEAETLDGAQARAALGKIFNLQKEGLTVEEVTARFLETDRSVAALYDTLLRLRMEKHGKERMGEKTPNNFWFLDVLFRWYPKARIIFMMRNPHDVHGSFKNFKNAAKLPWKDRMVLSRALYWSYGARVLKESQARYPGQVMRVSFEALVQAPETVLPAVCDFLDEDYHEEMLEVRAVNSSFDQMKQQSGFRKETLQRHHLLSFSERLLIDVVSGTYILENGYPLAVLPNAVVQSLEAGGFYKLVDAAHRAIRKRRVH